jgi:hypothetical protein
MFLFAHADDWLNYVGRNPPTLQKLLKIKLYRLTQVRQFQQFFQDQKVFHLHPN